MAAFEWCHSSALGNTEHPANEHLKTYLEKQQVLKEGLTPSQMLLVEDMKTAVEKLIETQETMDSCEAASITVGMKLQQHLISSLSGCIDEEKRTSLLETLQILLEGRNNWRREASQHIAGMVNVVTTLLQFEFSRSGQTWNLGEAVNEGFLEANCDVAGEAPDDESFTNFDMWLNKLCDVTGVIQESKQVLKDCQDATDMTRSQIQQYQSQKQSSLEAIADVSQSISKSISNLSNAAGAVRHYSEKMTREDPTTRVFLTETIGENCFFLSALFIV